jgi:HJR/Mrr/RecB family endonuclease
MNVNQFKRWGAKVDLLPFTMILVVENIFSTATDVGSHSRHLHYFAQLAQGSLTITVYEVNFCFSHLVLIYDTTNHIENSAKQTLIQLNKIH